MKNQFKMYIMLLAVGVFFSVPVTATATNLTENDYYTNPWDRFQYNYEFGSGAEYESSLGKPTGTDIEIKPKNQNIRINKDFSYTPLPYGIFSGEIETQRSNPYFSPVNYMEATVTDVTNYGDTVYTNQENINGTGGFANGTAVIPDFNFGGNGGSTVYIDYENNNHTNDTLPLYYNDGSIGRLTIEEYDRKLTVWEGETLDNLDKGVGHFSFTSTWDGNVAIAGHNDDEFRNLHRLQNGDRITYETKYGVREYEIVDVYTIDENNFTPLEDTSDNRLTMITCVEDEPDKRYCVVAEEI